MFIDRKTFGHMENFDNTSTSSFISSVTEKNCGVKRKGKKTPMESAYEENTRYTW